MDEHASEATQAQSVPPPASPAWQLQQALDQLNHLSNLAVPDRLHALQNAVNVIATQLMPLLPTE